MACGWSNLAARTHGATKFQSPVAPPASRGVSAWTGCASTESPAIARVVTLASWNGNGRIHVGQKKPRSTRRRRLDESPVTFLDAWDTVSTGTLALLLDTIDRLFDATLNAAIPNTIRRAAPAQWGVSEDENFFYLRVNLPGFGKEDVKVCVEDQTLVIKAERQAAEGEGGMWASSSSSSSQFSTQATLPESVVVEEIQAHMKNGVLSVALPKTNKTEENQMKNIIDVEVL